MSTIYYHKLIRDNIPEIIEASGKTCKTEILSDEEYLKMIDAKLDEELAEYHKDQNLEELADVLEVLMAAVKARGYSMEELEAVRAKKAEKNGAFKKKLLLTEVEDGIRQGNAWAVSCNLKYYDVYGAFENLKILDWKQTSVQMKVGDIVYIYISAPEMEVRYKCRVNKINLLKIEIDDSRFSLRKNSNSFEEFSRHMELELLTTYPAGTITKEGLQAHGLKGNIMRPRKLEGELREYIESF